MSLPILLLLLLFTTTPSIFSLPQTECANNVNNNAFSSTIQSTLSEITSLISTISAFTPFIPDTRLNSAITDCLDLLSLSSDELSLPNTTSNHNHDLHTYVSAALSNQDTCKESLSSTNSILGNIASSALEQISSLISNLLRQLPQGTHGAPFLQADSKLIALAEAVGTRVDCVVAKDGTGNFTTIGEAVEKAPNESETRFVIYVKKGVYKENVDIKKKKWNVMMIGDGIDVTVISGSRNFIDGWTTYRSATVGISGKGFIARDLTIENTAGPEKHQAVALRSDSDLSVYYRCAFRGYQDTLYAHSLRQFYRECIITGTVDFIFGNAAAVIQNSVITARQPLPNQKNSITAQGRKDPNQNTGFSIQLCNITSEANSNTTYTYLGRPWKEYSRTVVMQSYISNSIRPEGWLEWQGDFALSTLYYAEYMNYGPGSGLGKRVKWPGYHAINESASARNFTVAEFIDGNLWLPSTGVKYTAGLMV